MRNTTQFNDPLDQYFGQSVSKPDGTLYSRHVVISKGVISSVEQLTYDTCRLKVKCTEGEFMRPLSGQFGTLKPDHLAKPRAYSFARAPQTEAPGEHTFIIRVMEGGLFSAWLFEEDRIGEPLTISGPLGKFLIDDSNRPMLCVAGGSGMSAIYSILEDAALKQVERDAVFLYGARSQKDLYLVDEINQFKWHPDYQFEFVPVLSEEAEDSDWQGARGMVTDYMKSTYLDSGRFKVDNCTAFFCGPPPMVNLGIKVLTDKGMDIADICYDKFEDARSPAPVIDNTKCVLCDECLMVRPTEHCINEIVQLPANGGDYKRLEAGDTSGLYYNALYIDDNECIRCWACVDACPTKAIHPDNDSNLKALRDIRSA